MPSSSPRSVVCAHCQHHHYCFKEDTDNDTKPVVRTTTVTQNRQPPQKPFPLLPPRKIEIVNPRNNIVRQPSSLGSYYSPDHELMRWIPGYVQPATRAALLKKMQERPSATDKSGYIYAFMVEGEITSAMTSAITSARFQIKIGREGRAGERLAYWSKHYDNLPWRSLIPPMEKKSTFVPAYKKVERLALMVIEDLAQHKAYLDPDSMKAGIPPSPRRKGSKEPCLIASCNTNHIEIFSIDSDANSLYFAEEEVVRMIKNWCKFSNEFDGK